MISIVLADDHQVVLDGFRALLASEPDLCVVGEATDGLEVLPLVARLRPDVLVLDILMPGKNGLEVARQVRAQHPDVKITMLSMHATDAYVSEAFRNGATGYVIKQAPAAEFVKAIRAVAGGQRYVSTPLSEEGIRDYEQRAQGAAIDLFDTLSTREREVFQLAAEGLTNAEIAKRLAIGRRTVETHRANLIRKLGLKSHADLVRLAVRRGVVSS